MVFIDLCSQLFSRNNVKVKTNNGILVINNKTSSSTLDDAKNSKLYGIELSNPEFVGLAIQDLKIMLNDALE